MTGNNVSQIADLLKNSKLLSASLSKQQESSLAFGSLLSQTSGGKQDNYASLPVASNNQTIYEKEAARPGYRDNKIPVKESVSISSKLPSDAVEKMDSFAENVKNMLEEKLGVSEEELTQAMELLGLNFMDLMDPSKLAALVMELTQSQDAAQLLLNQDFQSLLGQMGEFSEDLMKQLNLTPEEMKQLMAQIDNMKQDVPKDGTIQVIQPETAEGEQGIPTDKPIENQPQTEQNVKPQQNVSQEQDVKATQDVKQTQDVKPEQNVKPEEAADDIVVGKTVENQEDGTDEQSNLLKNQNLNTGKASGQPSGGTQEEMTGQSQDDAINQQSSMNSKGMEKTDSAQSGMNYQTTVQTINHGQTVEMVKTITPVSIDIENLIRQVSQMTRITISNPAETAISMQLNPENLGKIYLQVVSRGGAITAQLAAQNEAVKEVLESQIAILKDNMNQQGIKVDAVEVTIASHEFEQNLEGNQGNQAKEQQDAEKSARRNINVQSLDELEGLMSEEENLAVKMMTENGNNVDFTA